MKFILLLIVAAITYSMWLWRRTQGRKRLQEIDEGKRCIACSATEIELAGGNARCLRCNHVVSLAAMQAAVVHDHEIANVTRPDDRRL
jgi:uncharacterized paraquat-inducible protein A